MGKRRSHTYVRNFTVTLMGNIGELDFFIPPVNNSSYFEDEFLRFNFEHNYATIAAGLNRFDSEVYGRIVANAIDGFGLSFQKILPYADMYHPRAGREFLRVVAVCVIFAEMLNIHRKQHRSCP